MQRSHWAQRGLRAFLCSLTLLGLIGVSGSALLGQESTGVIYGRVTDSRGSPQRLMVHLFAPGEMPAGDLYTDAEGQYAFKGLPGGEYWVVVEAEGFQPARQAVRLDTQVYPKVQVNLTLEKTAAGPAAPGPIIAGSPSSYIVDAKKRAPVFDPRALREFGKGNRRQKKGDLEGAIAHYQKALRIDPSFYPALNNLGGAYERQGDHQRAEQVLLKALELNPNDSQSYVNLGHVFYEEGRYPEARARLEEGIKRSPNSAAARFFLGSTELKLGDLGPAESNLKQACVLDAKGMPAAHLQLANLYLRTHDLRAAGRELEDYLRANPDDPQAPAIRKLLATTQAQRN